MVTKISIMNPMPFARGILLSTALLASGVAASAADRFALAVGPHDMLVVLSAKGEQKAELPLPTLSQNVTMDETTFQLSYGRDANNSLTAILAPNPTQPQDLHFNVLGKAIDTDKSAVVTLTFSKSLNSVHVDPGYIGEVEVNAQRLRHDAALNGTPHLAIPGMTASPNEQATLAGASAPKWAVAAAATTQTPPAPVTLPIPAPPTGQAANQSANISTPTAEVDGSVPVHAPSPMQVNDASQMPFTATATPGPSTVSVVGSETAPKQHVLYWSEPITPPGGKAPEVASNEMKLIELQGSASVTEPGASSHDATEGMLVPSGSTISTSGSSSLALFMGGVNSIRLMPGSEIQVTQTVDGSVRKTLVTLHSGTVFSRVGHRDGEKEDYRVQTPEGVAVAKGTEFADTVSGGHHYVFVVKGIVAMLIHDIQTGLLTPTPNNMAAGAMPPSDDGNKILFAVLNQLQPFQHKLQKVIAAINNGTATPEEIGFYDQMRKTFSVAVDDNYDPTHPNQFLGPFTSTTGYGDQYYGSLERPQDFGEPNPNNPFSDLQLGAARPFVTPAVTATTPAQLVPGNT